MRNSPSCGCCYCSRCREAFDDFNRADSSSIGANWTENAGDWEIATNRLVTSDDDAVATWSIDHSGGLAAHVVTVDFEGADVGDELLVMLGWVDASNYLAARVTIGDAASCPLLELVSVEAGVESLINSTLVPGLVADAIHRLKVCYYYDGTNYVGRLSAELRTSSGLLVRLSGLATTTGLRVGLGTGAITTEARFDNFCWQSHYLPTVVSGYGPSLDCPRCLGVGCQYSEDYLLAAGTDLGCAWEECAGSAGDWEIEDSGGGVLAITIDAAGSEVLHKISQPYAIPYQRVAVDVKSEDVGDVIRILVARNDCANSIGCGIELEFGTTCGIARIVDGGTAGPDLPLVGLVADKWHAIEVCVGYANHGNLLTANRVSAIIDTADYPAVKVMDEVSSTVGKYVSFRAEALTTKAWFRNFTAEMSYRDPESPNCNTCNGRDEWCVWGVLTCDDVDSCLWTAVSGSWTCGATASDNALKRFDVEQPLHSNTQRATGTIDATGDAEAIVYIAYEDATEYMALRVTFGGTCPMVELIEDGVVLRTVEDSRIVPGTSIAFCVQFDRNELSAWYQITGLGSEPIYLEAAATGHGALGAITGKKAAIGTGTVTTGTVTFSDVALWVSKHTNQPQCDDCDVCYLWHAAETLAGGAAFQGTAGASLSCEYGGTAVYGTVNDQALGTSVEAAIVPAGGSMTFDVGTDDGETVAYVSFYLTARPAVLTVTSCGVAAVLTVASNGTATLAVAGGTATSISVVAIETQYTLKLCSFGADSRALLLDGDWQVSGASFGSAIGSGTVNGSTVTIAATTNDIAVRSVGVTRHLKNDGETSCGECEPFCDVCENNQMPSQILVEFEGCDGVFLPDLGCCSLNGAWFVTMGDCGGVLEWTDAQGDKRIEVELTDHTTYVAVRVYWEHYESGFGGALIGSGEWGADLTKPVDCLHFSRQELDIDAGVVSASDPVCAASLTGTQCFISAA